MPTYHYACTSCAHEFDQYQTFAENSLTVCPSCDGRIRRVIQPVGVVFKGTGWYLTDSRKPDKSENGATAQETSTEPTKAESGATESKSDGAKPDSNAKQTKAAPEGKPVASKSVESKPAATTAS